MKESIMYISAADFFYFIKVNELSYDENSKEVFIEEDEKSIISPEVRFYQDLSSIGKDEVIPEYYHETKFTKNLPEVYYKVIVKWKDKGSASINNLYDFSYIKIIGMSLITSDTDLNNINFDEV